MITIDEAIEISTKERKEHHSFPTDIIGQAAQLGIEAQKAWIEGRRKHGWFYFPLLPGETEEGETK